MMEPLGVLLLFACVVYFGGLSAGWSLIKQIGSAVAEVFKAMAVLAIRFRDELGITDWLWTRGIYAFIAIAAALLSGYVFTRKEQKKLLGVISSVVSVVSTLLTFA